MSKLDSDIIRLLRFPLAVMVVFLHSEPSIEGWNITNVSYLHLIKADIVGIIMYSISHILTQTAVPLFFLISGYLFFVKLEEWDYKIYRRKMLSRVRTLLVPYLIWVTLFCGIHIFRHILPIGGIHDFHVNLCKWLSDQGGVCNLYWSSSKWIYGASNIFGNKVIMTGPMPFHLWFLRDLIVAVILSPLYFFLFRRGDEKSTILSRVSIVILIILALLQIQTKVPGLDTSSLAYYGIGAFLSLNRKSLAFSFRFRYLVASIAFVMFVILIPMDGSKTPIGSMLFPLWIFTGVLTILNMMAAYVRKNKITDIVNRVNNSVFFLYIIHPFFLGIGASIVSHFMTLLGGGER